MKEWKCKSCNIIFKNYHECLHHVCEKHDCNRFEAIFFKYMEKIKCLNEDLT